MRTLRVGTRLSRKELKKVIETLEKGRLVVYPTDTLYALGADPSNEEAMKKLSSVKRRPEDAPISLCFAGVGDIEKVASIGPRAGRLVKELLPGPLTLVLEKKKEDDYPLASATHLIGVRIPKDEIALQIAREFGPVTATSANTHSGRIPVNVRIAQEELGEAVDLYIDGGNCKLGKPSTVVEVSSDKIRVIREGVIHRARLEHYGSLCD